MRLLNTATLQLQEFWDANIPAYAILSHTWDNEEVTLQEFNARSEAMLDKAGYVKIRKAAEIAARGRHTWIWIDTCCIDKQSSAELSEAINSMYNWYEKAVMCYAYLSDYESDEQDGDGNVAVTSSRWFKRGWTLQELLAPSVVQFFDQRWRVVGTKLGLAKSISSNTGIHVEILKKKWKLRDFSLAQRMSWAAERKTTRVEDIAYCLLGIFEINMPLLYGEGERAFLRLQETIMSRSFDDSLLAWGITAGPRDLQSPGARPRNGLLATSPAQFKSCSSIVRSTRSLSSTRTLNCLVTHDGVSVRLAVQLNPRRQVFALLQCIFYTTYNVSHEISLELWSIDTGRYFVADIHLAGMGLTDPTYKTFVILQDTSDSKAISVYNKSVRIGFLMDDLVTAQVEGPCNNKEALCGSFEARVHPSIWPHNKTWSRSSAEGHYHTYLNAAVCLGEAQYLHVSILQKYSVDTTTYGEWLVCVEDSASDSAHQSPTELIPLDFQMQRGDINLHARYKHARSTWVVDATVSTGEYYLFSLGLDADISLVFSNATQRSVPPWKV